jgi:hypothetical protein
VPQVYNWTIDTLAPVVTLVGSPYGRVNSPKFFVTVRFAEPMQVLPPAPPPDERQRESDNERHEGVCRGAVQPCFGAPPTATGQIHTLSHAKEG